MKLKFRLSGELVITMSVLGLLAFVVFGGLYATVTGRDPQAAHDYISTVFPAVVALAGVVIGMSK